MQKGKLKIFFGYSAGVGKTYAMLQAAQILKDKGVDTVIGYVEPHQRPDTQKLTGNLEQLTLRRIEYRGVTLYEFDVDAAVHRHPQLILIDELAHTNAAGSKHAKRYMDIEEVLNAGINVYTTVNVQHIESLNDIIGSITGIRVQETVPDSVFDGADEVELIDIEPQELEERLRSGKVYQAERAAVALENFFTRDKLDPLREIAMRRTADRIERKTQTASIKPHILVLVSPSPSSAKNIRTASRMAENAHTRFCALYVERSGSLSENSQETLKAHMRLIRNLGGELTVRYADDVIDVITHFVRQNGVTTIILGKTWQSAGKKPGFEDRIVSALPDVEILIIPDSRSASASGSNGSKIGHRKPDFLVSKRKLFLLTCGALWCAAGFALQILNPLAAVCAQTAAAVFFCAVLIRNSVRTAKLHMQYRETNRTLDALQAIDRAVTDRTAQPEQEDIPLQQILCQVLADIFKRSVQISVYPTTADNPEQDAAVSRISIDDEDISFFSSQAEQAVGSWCRINKKNAGCGTDTLRQAQAAYYPIIQGDDCIAVIAFSCRQNGSLILADRLLFTQIETRLIQLFSLFL